MINPFIHAQGKCIVDAQGNELLLKGIGLGGWLLPEGYMWKFPQEGDRPRKIENYVTKCIGAQKAKVFWLAYHTNFITLADIQAIKHEGFNSVRIPLHGRFLLTELFDINLEHFAILDQVIQWCEQERLYVILDLHGAIGGQTGTNIDDSEHDQPELFIKKSNQDITIKLWEEIVRRYKDKEIIACYDLLNEPLPNWFSQYHPQLVEFYQRLITSIRAIDPYHMISIEGVHWATDWSIFESLWDDNVLYQFHKYWNNPDQASLQKYLDFRDQWSVPIFMGEGGENNKEWYTGTFAMLEDFNISYNFWTYKKMETTNSPYSIQSPKDWHLLSSAIAQSELLDPSLCEQILRDFTDKVNLENCTYIPGVANAIFRRPPLLIPAIFFDWNQEKKHLTHRENIGYRVEDGVEIRFLGSDKTSPNFNHGQGQAWSKDDWLMLVGYEKDEYHYRIHSNHKQEYMVFVELAAECPSILEVSCGHQLKSIRILDLNKKTLMIGSFLLEQGDNKVSLKIESGKIKLISLSVK